MNKTNRTRALGYIQGLVSCIGRANCVKLAQHVGVSHDRLTKLLNTTNIDWTSVLTSVMFRIFGSIVGGYLIIDETTIDKSYAKIIEGCNWIWSSKGSRFVFGYHVTLLLWSSDSITIPLALKVYKKSNMKKDQITSIDIALELLMYAKNVLKIKPDWVFMDGYYSADKVLKMLHDWEWSYVMRVKKNRVLNGTKISKLHLNPYWEEIGNLKCKLTVRIIRHGKRYFITNDITTDKKVIYALYGERWSIEEVFRVLHAELGLDECESRSRNAQMTHFNLVLIAYGLLQSEKTRTECGTHYSIINKYRMESSFTVSSSYAGLFEGA
jgi:putative transposase